ncbi:hypothetical protein KTE19_00800 [Lentilactobacillus sp. IMAU92037]|uniref:hypothetical protein n=1 Tax=Lentilactobacillus dabitei TaxID=2831523 RepID=UPI001C2C126B|nr:hypothetical protein [Lentilactobacillus dabitei]MBV0929268.1 hypothetical protein [Lentilactobacillus dabitei]
MSSGGDVFGSNIIGSPGFDVTKWFTQSNSQEFVLKNRQAFEAKPYQLGDQPTPLYDAAINGDSVILTKVGNLDETGRYQVTKAMTLENPITYETRSFLYVNDHGWVTRSH